VLGGLIVGLLALGLIVWLWTRRTDALARHPSIDCPTCRQPMRALSEATDDDDPPRGYEVLACPTCDVAVSAVHAVASAWGYCPACMQRSLQIQCAKLPVAPGRPPIARAEETCHLCGHERTRTLGGAAEASPAAQGRVIPFPAARRRR